MIVAWDTAVVTGLVGLIGGSGVPRLIAAVPEPAPAAVPAASLSASGAPVDTSGEVAPDKERYADIAGLPGLRGRAALAAALAAAALGAGIGWDWSLLPLIPLVPVGVALAVIDWRTRLLPTWLIVRSYLVVGALAGVATLLSGDVAALRRAGWGWLLAGATFLLLWLVFPRGMGYGDVRLSGVLGMSLGYLGWGQLVVGVYAGFVLGGVIGVALSLVGVLDRRAYPFGPFMLLGALVGVLTGPGLAALWLGQR